MGFLDEAWDAVSGAASGAAGSFMDVVEDIVEKAEEAAKDVEDAAEDMVDDVKETWSEAGDRMSASWKEGGVFGVMGAFVGGIVGLGGDIGCGLFSIGGAALGGSVRVAGAIGGGLFTIAGRGVEGAGGDYAGAWGRFFQKIGTGIRDGSDELGDAIRDAGKGIGKWIHWISHAAGDLIYELGLATDCFIFGLFRRDKQGNHKVDHFFVLMLENRSFDHMLGDLFGVPARDGNAADNNGLPYTFNAPDVSPGDPPHEFLETRRAMWGTEKEPAVAPQMRWFADEYERKYSGQGDRGATVMRGFPKETAGVINGLARQFAVCTKWFSSIPGPTFPNRLFLYGGSSSGLASSQSTEYLAAAHVALGVRFQNGSLFDRLRVKCVAWRVYHGDLFPTCLSVRGMVREFVDFTPSFRSLDDFRADLQAADDKFPGFTFIEPSYGRFWSDYKFGNSQHPTDSMQSGEALIRYVYEAIRDSPIWKRSALIVTYDEHGGFYDHVSPPQAPPPGDRKHFVDANSEDEAKQFKFDWYGVRVPALVISPWVDPGSSDDTVRDHTSVIRTLCERFGMSPLTQRDAQAAGLSPLFSRNQPRDDRPDV